MSIGGQAEHWERDSLVAFPGQAHGDRVGPYLCNVARQIDWRMQGEFCGLVCLALLLYTGVRPDA
jgi:hypothetical protein